ncbi:hypothetical protein HPB47_006226 [Ixodes persulcatus]|uniref:Uncharacterized protein n=1 Tax=Ixodes persulcatus TaxID=34615 RepID=A0AC60PBL8_IXOPE|nr:hypothetical protein HPB47_006226 [Ixodes persulcatus]
MASVKKRRNLDFATKLKVIQRVEAGEKSSTVADDIGIPRSTPSTLLKNKADIKAKAAEQRTSGACRVRAAAHGKVEKALYAWFLEVRAKNIPVDGPMLMAKAKWFAAALGEDNFGDNTGWLHRFKQRYNIVGKTISGESEANGCKRGTSSWASRGVALAFLWTTEDGDEERIDDAFRELSALFPAAVPPEVSADDFVEVDCNVQAFASLADEDIVAAVAGTQDAQADSSSGDEDRPNEAAATRAYSAAEMAAMFGLIRRCCGDMEGTGLSHLDSLDKIEASLSFLNAPIVGDRPPQVRSRGLYFFISNFSYTELIRDPLRVRYIRHHLKVSRLSADPFHPISVLPLN